MQQVSKRSIVGKAVLGIATVVVMLLSMAAVGAASPVSAGAASASTSLPPTAASSTPVGQAPTAVGLASQFLIDGAKGITPIPAAASAMAGPAGVGPLAQMPSPNPRPGLDLGVRAATISYPPTVTCRPLGPGCDSINTGNDGATTDPYGINAFNNDAANGETVEPPDQGMCAGNGYVIEMENLGELRIFNSNFQGGSSVITLDSLMGLTQLGWSSGGDIQCLYDYSNGGHWFVTEIVSRSSEASGGTFVGCFAAKLNGCLEGLAVSVTNNPTGAWNIYFVDPNRVNHDPGKGYLLNDFAKDATTQNAFLMFYDEFILNGSRIPKCPAYGCFGFNGAQELALNKVALELGYPVVEVSGAPDPYFTYAYENLGTAHGLQPPGQPCYKGSTAGITCWYQVIPAQSPDPSQFDNAHGGSGFMFGSLDFFGAGDNRIEAFYWTGLSSLDSYNCDSCSGANGVHFGGQLFTNVTPYRDEGAACPAADGGFCGLGAQRHGHVPLGANCVALGLAKAGTKCPEQGIASDGDGFTQASYGEGQVWGAISTLVNQKFGTGQCGVGSTECEVHVGVAYFVIGTTAFNDGGMLTMTDNAYVTAAHEDLEFPAIAAGDTVSEGALMAFTLSGNGGPTGADNGGFFPSTAFGFLTTTSHGLSGSVIHIADLGRGAQDGFTEYLGLPGGIRPRWGDYTVAVFVPANGGQFYFAGEYIEHPNCSPAQYLADPSCGDTRAPYANWGNSINWVA
jgi:hypothetical protein